LGSGHDAAQRAGPADRLAHRDLSVADYTAAHSLRLAADAWVGPAEDRSGGPAEDLAKVRDSLSGADHDFLWAKAAPVGRYVLPHLGLLPRCELRQAAGRVLRDGWAAESPDLPDESVGPEVPWVDPVDPQARLVQAKSALAPPVVVERRAEDQPQALKVEWRARRA